MIEDKKTIYAAPPPVTQASTGSHAVASVRCIGGKCQGALDGGCPALRCLSLRRSPGARGRVRPSPPTGAASTVRCVGGKCQGALAGGALPYTACHSVARLGTGQDQAVVARQSAGARAPSLCAGRERRGAEVLAAR
jgi:hypothetical protein